jgi:cytochrome c biogenesis factor
VINFIGNIKITWKKEKWATLLLHLSWIFIISGAFVTRYISYEGMMPIREGAAKVLFRQNFPYCFFDGDYKG